MRLQIFEIQRKIEHIRIADGGRLGMGWRNRHRHLHAPGNARHGRDRTEKFAPLLAPLAMLAQAIDGPILIFVHVAFLRWADRRRSPPVRTWPAIKGVTDEAVAAYSAQYLRDDT